MKKIIRYTLLFTIILGIVYYVWPENKLEQNQRIALVYNDEQENASNLTPTAFGYGSSVDPFPWETCTPCSCEKKNWTYSFMYKNLPKTEYSLNNTISTDLIKIFDGNLPYTIFFEKHLQERFKLHGDYAEAGCGSVRHDDHFHVQLGNL